jgi:hypothetical protein
LKRSGGKGNTAARHRYRCTLYLDENLCQTTAILEVLQEEAFPFRRHLEFFERGIADDVWLQLPGLMGWLVLTKDTHQRYQPLEKAQLLIHCIREFAFSSGNLSGVQMAELLRRNLRKIDNLGHNHPPPFVASITSRGVHLRQLY